MTLTCNAVHSQMLDAIYAHINRWAFDTVNRKFRRIRCMHCPYSLQPVAENQHYTKLSLVWKRTQLIRQLPSSTRTAFWYFCS